MLLEKELVEDEEPCEFDTNDLCLTVGCTNERKGQLLNIVRQFEEDENEGGIMDMWNVYVLNIYLLILLQVLCKCMARMVNKEVELLGSNQISFHWLKENIKE